VGRLRPGSGAHARDTGREGGRQDLRVRRQHGLGRRTGDLPGCPPESGQPHLGGPDNDTNGKRHARAGSDGYRTDTGGGERPAVPRARGFAVGAWAISPRAGGLRPGGGCAGAGATATPAGGGAERRGQAGRRVCLRPAAKTHGGPRTVRVDAEDGRGGAGSAGKRGDCDGGGDRRHRHRRGVLGDRCPPVRRHPRPRLVARHTGPRRRQETPTPRTERDPGTLGSAPDSRLAETTDGTTKPARTVRDGCHRAGTPVPPTVLRAGTARETTRRGR